MPDDRDLHAKRVIVTRWIDNQGREHATRNEARKASAHVSIGMLLAQHETSYCPISAIDHIIKKMLDEEPAVARILYDYWFGGGNEQV